MSRYAYFVLGLGFLLVFGAAYILIERSDEAEKARPANPVAPEVLPVPTTTKDKMI